jgi:hypothetical protein
MSAGAARAEDRETLAAARFGWTALAGWALFGLVLEAAHGFKLAAYLDDDLRHSLLRLAHAHGVVLALVVLALGRQAGGAEPGEGGGARWTGRLVRAGALLIPVGFALSAIAPHEGDPGWPVALVPLGGLALVVGLVRAAARAWRRTL